MWEKMIEASVGYDRFIAGCEVRMADAFLEMTVLFRKRRELKEALPYIPEGTVLLCFCEPRCLDCHPLLPLLKMVTANNRKTVLGILSHRQHVQFLRSNLTDPALPTLPTVTLLSEEGTPHKVLCGRPENLDVVTWRTGKGWRELFRFLDSPKHISRCFQG